MKHYGRWSRRADAEREAGTMALKRFLWNTRPSMPKYGLVTLKPYMSAQGSEYYASPHIYAGTDSNLSRTCVTYSLSVKTKDMPVGTRTQILEERASDRKAT